MRRWFHFCFTIAFLCMIASPEDADAQWQGTCAGRWVPYGVGVRCVCPDGSDGYYSGGRHTCGGGHQGYYQPAPQSRCPAGHYEYGRYCVQNGNTVCDGSGGARSCPSHLKCAYGGGCIPHDATDCGGGSYCSNGRFCWTDPEGVPGFDAGTQRCLTAEQFNDANNRVQQYYVAHQQAEDERRERERVSALEEKRDEIDAAQDELDRETERLARRIASDNDASEQVEGDSSPEEIMRELRERSVLDRLRETEAREGLRPRTATRRRESAVVAAPAPRRPSRVAIAPHVSGQGGFPSRQTPAPRYVLPSNRETALLPTPRVHRQRVPSIVERPTYRSRSFVQGWLINRPFDPDDISEASRRATEEARRRAEQEAELDRIGRSTRRAQQDAHWDAVGNLSILEEGIERTRDIAVNIWDLLRWERSIERQTIQGGYVQDSESVYCRTWLGGIHCRETDKSEESMRHRVPVID